MTPAPVLLGPVENPHLGPIYLFHCPGCEENHWFRTSGEHPTKWTWNGDRFRPTISPSLLVQGGNESGPTTCHSFVNAGQIQFLSDCTHKLAGQTVPLPPWDDDGEVA